LCVEKSSEIVSFLDRKRDNVHAASKLIPQLMTGRYELTRAWHFETEVQCKRPCYSGAISIKRMGIELFYTLGKHRGKRLVLVPVLRMWAVEEILRRTKRKPASQPVVVASLHYYTNTSSRTKLSLIFREMERITQSNCYEIISKMAFL